MTYVAADAAIGVFNPSAAGYTSPGEFKATLAHEGAGWKLTDHDSGGDLHFTSAGLLSYATDRNGNHVDVSYDSNNHQTSISASRGSVAVRTGKTAYGSNGFISSFSQSGDDGTSRNAAYGYNAIGDLTSLTDPAGKTTRFGYDSSHELTSITTPTGKVTTSTRPGNGTGFLSPDIF